MNGLWGSGVMVHSWCMVRGSFMVHDSLFIVHDLWFMVHGSEFIHDAWSMVHGSGFIVKCMRLVCERRQKV